MRPVGRPGEKFLPGSRFARDQEAAVGLRNARNRIQRFDDLAGFANHIGRELPSPGTEIGHGRKRSYNYWANDMEVLRPVRGDQARLQVLRRPDE